MYNTPSHLQRIDIEQFLNAFETVRNSEGSSFGLSASNLEAVTNEPWADRLLKAVYATDSDAQVFVLNSDSSRCRLLLCLGAQVLMVAHREGASISSYTRQQLFAGTSGEQLSVFGMPGAVLYASLGSPGQIISNTGIAPADCGEDLVWASNCLLARLFLAQRFALNALEGLAQLVGSPASAQANWSRVDIGILPEVQAEQQSIEYRAPDLVISVRPQSTLRLAQSTTSNSGSPVLRIELDVRASIGNAAPVVRLHDIQTGEVVNFEMCGAPWEMPTGVVAELETRINSVLANTQPTAEIGKVFGSFLPSASRNGSTFSQVQQAQPSLGDAQKGLRLAITRPAPVVRPLQE